MLSFVPKVAVAHGPWREASQRSRLGSDIDDQTALLVVHLRGVRPLAMVPLGGEQNEMVQHVRRAALIGMAPPAAWRGYNASCQRLFAYPHHR